MPPSTLHAASKEKGGEGSLKASFVRWEVRLRYGQAVKTFCQKQLCMQHEKEQQGLGSDAAKFNPDEHLIFSLPENTWTLADIQLGSNNAITPFAFSGGFPLFSAEAIGKMRRELLSDTVRQKFQKSSDIVSCQLRGMVPEYVSLPKNRNKTDKYNWIGTPGLHTMLGLTPRHLPRSLKL